jgi:hypothetical protein
MFHDWIASAAAHLRANVRRRPGEDRGRGIVAKDGAIRSAEFWNITAFFLRDFGRGDGFLAVAPASCSTLYFAVVEE